MNSLPIHLVCFDLGGVLIRICRDWRHTFEITGTPVPAAMNDPAVVAGFYEQLVPFETGRMDEGAFYEDCARRVGVPAEVAAACFEAWMIGAYPGAYELMERVGDAGVPLACLSNTNITHWRGLHEQGEHVRLPLDRLRWKFASHEVGLMKPDAAIYEHVERQTGVAPGRIVFFDDRPENCDAARARGWQAHDIDPDADPPRQMTEHLTRLGVLPDGVGIIPA